MYSPIYNSKYIPLFIMRTYAHMPTRAPTRTPSPPHAQENTAHPKPKNQSPKKRPKIQYFKNPILKNGFQRRTEKSVKNLNNLSPL